ncbi:MAG TPA: bifunctional diaminohydroxyphosphoribosylaminopyrimidine deaminase/5-amino-6-(5-phosphoribosylamino)uracil reductase RibD, partial [Candidatus Micrarchaeota archaeon]|nr:bifunctional diaminohydroxyphosphoribosylaminopyrimidine deaminase/5-amino-6-(5-phosphoribosylamino)uracil reductase RibD [Candidatus Micrarchaeota archaeon]
MGFNSQDRKFMSRCLELAEMGAGRVSPNPLVGCVVVRNGKAIGEGYHEYFGGRHAESNALHGIDAAGATIYVSLEPCSGVYPGKKTPPCSHAIIRSGARRVVVAAKDSNPAVDGIGVLRGAGIKVTAGLLAQHARRQNEPYFKMVETGMPLVAVKLAQSKNGVIGIRGRSRVWITGREFADYAHSLRNSYDAIMVGINTILADDPELTCRIKGGRNPARVIVDSTLRLPLGAKALENARREKVIVATSEKCDLQAAKKLRALGATVLVCGKRKVDMRVLMKKLGTLGLNSVLIEGGAGLVSS